MDMQINLLKKFAEGDLNIHEFEQLLYYENELIKVLSDKNLVDYSKIYIDNYNTIYDYLISLNYKNPEDKIEAHFTICKFLKELNVIFKENNMYEETYNLLLDSQPEYLDISLDFFEKNIWKSEYSQLSKNEQKKKIKANIKSLFKFNRKTPKWIQAPDWLIENDIPLYFLGQYEIKNCHLFHDDGYVYLFINEEKKIKTVTQFY